MSLAAAERSRRVLVLGAYSAIGQQITEGLLADGCAAVRATGRDPEKLAALSQRMSGPRLTLSQLDVEDACALRQACTEADVVVNCVGPYIMSGYDVAAVVVGSRRHCVDFAFEQFHYKRLQTLHDLARANDVALVSGAGEVVGLSSILCAHARDLLGSVEKLVVYALEGKLSQQDGGFSSLMNGALEPALRNQDYLGGRYVDAKMGAELPRGSFPEPWGEMQLLSDPTIDSLILPQACGASTVRNFFGMGIAAPPGFFALARLLDPYRHRVCYRLAASVIRRLMRSGEQQKSRAGIPRAQLLRVEADSAGRSVRIDLTCRGAFNCTACLPVLIAGLLVRGEIHARGLLTALDLVSPTRLFEELQRYRRRGLDWEIHGPQAAFSAPGWPPRLAPVVA